MTALPDQMLCLMLSSITFIASIKQIRAHLSFSSICIFAFVLATCISQYSTSSLEYVSLPSHIPFITIGSLMYGLSISLLLEYVPATMRIADTLRGTQFSEQFAPELGNRDSYLETYATTVVLAIFFESKSFLKCVDIYISVISSWTQAQFISIHALLKIIASYITFSVFFIFPLVLFTLIAEVCLSTLQKIYPKLQIGHELTIVKNVLCMAFIAVIAINYEEIADKISSYTQESTIIFK